MSQFFVQGNGGGGGTPIETINGDVGSISGSTVTIYADNIANNSGSSVKFTNSGTTSLFSLSDLSGNTMLGNHSGNLTGTFSDCVAIGDNSGRSLTVAVETVLLGLNAGAAITSGGGTVAIGAGCLQNLVTGSSCVGIGIGTGTNYVGGESNNIIISNLGVANESNVIRIGSDGQQNTCFIAGILGNTASNAEFVTINSSTGQLGVSSGSGSGITTISGDSGSITGSSVIIFANTLGNNCGSSVKFVNSSSTSTLNLTDSLGNVFLGLSAGNASVSGANNSGQGKLALASVGSADSNCGLGSTCLTTLTSGANNCAVGVVALQNLVSGNNCVGIGHAAGQSYTSSESNNICIGSGVTGTVSESNVTRIGNGSTASCFITGISGVTVTGTAVLCSATGQLGTVASSIRYKENIQPIDDAVSILHLEPKVFNYTLDKDKISKYGLIAEEVDINFPYLCFYNNQEQPESVQYHELPVLLLHEMRKMAKRIEYLEEQVRKHAA